MSCNRGAEGNEGSSGLVLAKTTLGLVGFFFPTRLGDLIKLTKGSLPLMYTDFLGIFLDPDQRRSC